MKQDKKEGEGEDDDEEGGEEEEEDVDVDEDEDADNGDESYLAMLEKLAKEGDIFTGEDGQMFEEDDEVETAIDSVNEALVMQDVARALTMQEGAENAFSQEVQNALAQLLSR